MKPLEALYLRSMPAATSFAYLLTGDPDAAKRIATTAFVRATGRFSHRWPRGGFDASLARGVVAAFLSSARRDAGIAHPSCDGGPHTGGHDARGSADGVLPALLSLPPRERVAVVLRGRGLSDEEIARALGCSLIAARSTIAEGERRLAEAFPGDRQSTR